MVISIKHLEQYLIGIKHQMYHINKKMLGLRNTLPGIVCSSDLPAG